MMESESDNEQEYLSRSSPLISGRKTELNFAKSLSPLTSLARTMEEEDVNLDFQHIGQLKKHCEVCYSKVSSPFTNHLDSLFQLIHCRGCGLAAHFICYGVDTHLVEGSSQRHGLIKSFVCEQCKEDVPQSDMNCYICNSKEGCLRMTVDKKWVHIPCAISNPNINFLNLRTMTVDLSQFRKETSKISLKKRCTICQGKVETLPCAGSEKYCHLHCGLLEAHRNPEKKLWDISFHLRNNRQAKCEAIVDEKKIVEDVEEMALSLKDLIETYGMRGKHGIITELRSKKSTKGGITRRKVIKDDPKVQTFIEEIIIQAKLCNKEIAEEEDLMEEEYESGFSKSVGGKVNILYGKSNEEILRMQRREMQEEENDILRDPKMNEEELAEALHNLYRELFNSKSHFEVDAETKEPKYRSDLPEFPHLRSISFPELLFFVLVFQKRADSAMESLCNKLDLGSLIKCANMIPFTLAYDLKQLNQKHFGCLIADILLEPFILRCAPESAYNPVSNTFIKDKILRNKGAIKQLLELQKLYSKGPHKIITPNFYLAIRYQKQHTFLQEFYTGMIKYFNDDNHKDPFAKFSNKSLPNPPQPIVSLYYSKLNGAGLHSDFPEMELLESILKQRPKIATFEPMMKRKFSEEESNYSEGSNFSRSKSRDEPEEFRRKPKKEIKSGKGSIPKPSKPVGGTGRGRGRPRKADSLANEIQKSFLEMKKKLEGRQTLEEAERMLEEEGGMNESLETRIEESKEWLKQYQTALTYNHKKLVGLADKVEKIRLVVPEMIRVLEFKRDWDLWKNKMEDFHKRLKKKVSNVYEDREKMIDYQELKELVEQKEELKQLEEDDARFKEIQKRYEAIEKIRDQIENTSGNDFSKIKDLEKQIKEYNINIPEIGEIKEKKKINEEIKELLDGYCTLEELERITERARQNLKAVDPDLAIQLRSKFDKAKKLSDDASKFLGSRKPTQVEELALMAFLLKDFEVKKIEGNEFRAVQRMVEDFLLFGKIFSIVFSTKPIDMERLENDEYPEFKGKTFEKLTSKCLEALDRKADNLKDRELKTLRDICVEFRQLHKTKNSYMHSFFEEVAKILNRTTEVFEFERREDAMSLESFSDRPLRYAASPKKSNANMMEIEEYIIENSSNSRTREMKPSVESYEGMIAQILKRADDQNPDYEVLFEELEHIITFATKESQKSANRLGGMLDIPKPNYKKLLEQAKWATDILSIKREVEEEKQAVPYSQLDRVGRKMEEFASLAKLGAAKTVDMWYKKAQNIRQEYYRDYEQKKVLQNIKDLDNITIEELIEKNRRKPNFDEVKPILTNMNNAKYFVLFNDEKEMIERDVNVFEEWAMSVKEVVKKYLPVLDKFIEIKERYLNYELDEKPIDFAKEEEVKAQIARKSDLIQKDLEWVKKELVNTSLRRRAEESNLKNFAFMYDTVKSLSAVEKKIDQETLERLIRSGKKIQVEKDERIQKLVKLLLIEKTQVETIKQFVEKMKRNEATVTVGEVQKIKGDLDECPISLLEEEVAVESYLRKKIGSKSSRGKESSGKTQTLRKNLTSFAENVNSGREMTRNSLDEMQEESLGGVHSNNEWDRKEDSLAAMAIEDAPKGEEDSFKNQKEGIREQGKGSANKEYVLPSKMLGPKTTGMTPKGSTSKGFLQASTKVSPLKGFLPSDVPEGTILGIFEGSLEGHDEKEYQKIGLYTCDPFNVVNKIPQINEASRKLRMEKRTSRENFEGYLNFSFAHKEKKSEKIIAGWVESDISLYQSRCDQIGKELLNNDVVTVCAYNESSKIYLLHKDQMKEEWRAKLHFKVRKLQRNSNPSLYFILVHKPYKLKEPIEFINPKVIPTNDKATPNVDDISNGKDINIEEEANFNSDVDNSSIEASPNHDEDDENELRVQKEFADEENSSGIKEEKLKTDSQNDRNLFYRDDEEEGKDGDQGWGISEKKSATKDREQRLMFGNTEDEWTLNHRREGWRGESVSQVHQNTNPLKRPFFGKNENDEHDQIIKKVKRDVDSYKNLVSQLQDLDQQQILEIAKGLNKAGRDVIIQMLKKNDENSNQSTEENESNIIESNLFGENPKRSQPKTKKSPMKNSQSPSGSKNLKNALHSSLKKSETTTDEHSLLNISKTIQEFLDKSNSKSSHPKYSKENQQGQGFRIGLNGNFGQGDSSLQRSHFNETSFEKEKVPSVTKSDSGTHERRAFYKDGGSKSAEGKTYGGSWQPENQRTPGLMLPSFLANLNQKRFGLQARVNQDDENSYFTVKQNLQNSFLNEGSFGFQREDPQSEPFSHAGQNLGVQHKGWNNWQRDMSLENMQSFPQNEFQNSTGRGWMANNFPSNNYQ